MARLEIELVPEGKARIQQEAEHDSLGLNELAQQPLLCGAFPAFITDDGEVFEIPDLPEDLGRACALASEPTFKKFWNTPEEDAAWRVI